MVTHDAVLGRAAVALPPRQRAAIVLRYYQDLTEAQTADAMGCSVGTVKSQVRGVPHEAARSPLAQLRGERVDIVSESLSRAVAT